MPSSAERLLPLRWSKRDAAGHRCERNLARMVLQREGKVWGVGAGRSRAFPSQGTCCLAPHFSVHGGLLHTGPVQARPRARSICARRTCAHRACACVTCACVTCACTTCARRSCIYSVFAYRTCAGRTCAGRSCAGKVCACRICARSISACRTCARSTCACRSCAHSICARRICAHRICVRRRAIVSTLVSSQLLRSIGQTQKASGTSQRGRGLHPPLYRRSDAVQANPSRDAPVYPKAKHLLLPLQSHRAVGKL